MSRSLKKGPFVDYKLAKKVADAKGKRVTIKPTFTTKMFYGT